MEEKVYIIKENLANKVLNYLASKPYVEVAQMISEMGQLKEINIAEPILLPPKLREVPQKEE